MVKIKHILIIICLALPHTTVQAFSFAMTGDIMMGTTAPERRLPSYDGALLFWYVSSTLQSADFAIGNLEGTLCDTYPTPRHCKDSSTCYHFKMPQHYVRNLVNAGFDAVSIANNHINDFGSEGRDSTVSTLKKAGISYTGIRGNCETAIVVRNGKKIGICSFSPNVMTVDIRNIAYATKLVRFLRDRCDYVVVSFHGGAEGQRHLHVTRAEEFYIGASRGNVYEFAHACIDAGADLIFGHGPHVPRALELYKGHLIAYSLGNFCTPYGICILGVSGYAPLLFVELDDKGLFVKGRIESYLQRKGAGPIRDVKEQAAQLIRSLTIQDFPDSGLLFDGNEIKRR